MPMRASARALARSRIGRQHLIAETVANVFALDLNFTPVEGFEVIDEAQQRAFARAAWTHNHDNLTLSHLKVDAA
jgi:hypothetical protein